MFSAKELLCFWFESLFRVDTPYRQRCNVWLGVDTSQDRLIRQRLLRTTLMASEGVLDEWANSKEGRLALCLIYDRIGRVCYRHTQLAFEHDHAIQSLVDDWARQGLLYELGFEKGLWFIVPLLCSERSEYLLFAQNQLQFLFNQKLRPEIRQLVSELTLLGERNQLVIEKFGRYPHRAKQLRKPLRAEEKQFVEQYEWQHWI